MKPFIFPQNAITAHTGCEDTVDNTLESVKTAFQSEAEIFEIDINFDKKGTPVLSHDTPTGGEVLLPEIFALMKEKSNILCNLDIKSVDNLKTVRASAADSGLLDRVFYTGIHEEFVNAARTDTPEIPYYLNVELLSPEAHSDEYVLSVINKVRQCGAVGINCRFNNISASMVEAFHKNSLLVSVWTVNNEVDMHKMIALNPDNITTKYPTLLKKIIKQSAF